MIKVSANQVSFINLPIRSHINEYGERIKEKPTYVVVAHLNRKPTLKDYLEEYLWVDIDGIIIKMYVGNTRFTTRLISAEIFEEL